MVVLLILLIMILLIHLNLKKKITVQIGNNDKMNVKIMLPLKCLSNFRRTLEMPLINCEINLMLTWSANCVTSCNPAAIKQQHLQ